MTHLLRSTVVAFCLLLGHGLGLAGAQPLAAPNAVVIGPGLVTSGQPSAQALAGLAQQGFTAVVYLAPSTVPDAVKDEPEILARQGVEFVHIPIPFGVPTAAHVATVSAALQRLQGRKVLVHCQVNMRASVMVFLHRVLHGREDPATAWESVSRVWSPEGAWKRLIQQQLSDNGIAFDPF